MKAYRYTFDSRDRGVDERLDVIDSKDGIWICYVIFNCVESSSKDIDITRWIAVLKRKAATRT